MAWGRGRASAETASAPEGAVWHVTANRVGPSATGERLDTHQDTPPDAFRV